MAEQEFILLNGQPFIFTTRMCSEFEIGGEIERSITGEAHKDYLTTKHRWSFSFESISNSDIYRQHKVYDTHQKITLTDYDEKTYTVLWTSEFAPEQVAAGWWNMQINLEEV
jgi:hypothetical protein